MPPLLPKDAEIGVVLLMRAHTHTHARVSGTLAIMGGKYTIDESKSAKYSAGLLELMAKMLDPNPDTRININMVSEA